MPPACRRKWKRLQSTYVRSQSSSWKPGICSWTRRKQQLRTYSVVLDRSNFEDEEEQEDVSSDEEEEEEEDEEDKEGDEEEDPELHSYMLIPIPIANALAPKTSPKSISKPSQPSPETLHNDNIRTYTLRTAIKSLIRLRLLVLRFHNVVSTDCRSGARPIARIQLRTYVNPTAHHIDHDDAHYVDHPTRPHANNNLA